MANLEYSPAALEKLGAIHRYISEDLQNPAGAANTINLTRIKISKLKRMPKIGAPLISRCPEIPKHFRDTRVLLCGQYLTKYLFDGTTVRVLAIYHTAEDYIRHLFEMYR